MGTPQTQRPGILKKSRSFHYSSRGSKPLEELRACRGRETPSPRRFSKDSRPRLQFQTRPKDGILPARSIPPRKIRLRQLPNGTHGRLLPGLTSTDFRTPKSSRMRLRSILPSSLLTTKDERLQADPLLCKVMGESRVTVLGSHGDRQVLVSNASLTEVGKQAQGVLRMSMQSVRSMMPMQGSEASTNWGTGSETDSGHDSHQELWNKSAAVGQESCHYCHKLPPPCHHNTTKAGLGPGSTELQANRRTFRVNQNVGLCCFPSPTIGLQDKKSSGPCPILCGTSPGQPGRGAELQSNVILSFREITSAEVDSDSTMADITDHLGETMSSDSSQFALAADKSDSDEIPRDASGKNTALTPTMDSNHRDSSVLPFAEAPGETEESLKSSSSSQARNLDSTSRSLVNEELLDSGLPGTLEPRTPQFLAEEIWDELNRVRGLRQRDHLQNKTNGSKPQKSPEEPSIYLNSKKEPETNRTESFRHAKPRRQSRASQTEGHGSQGHNTTRSDGTWKREDREDLRARRVSSEPNVSLWSVLFWGRTAAARWGNVRENPNPHDSGGPRRSNKLSNGENVFNKKTAPDFFRGDFISSLFSSED